MSQTVGTGRYLAWWQKLALGGACVVAVGASWIFLMHKDWFLHSRPTPPPLPQMNEVVAPYNPTNITFKPVVTPGNQLPALPKPPNNEQLVALQSDPLVTGSQAPDKRAAAAGASDDGKPAPGSKDALAQELETTDMVGSKIAELPDPRFLISAGRVLPCTQQTKINTSFPGAVTATIPGNIPSDTGDVTALDAGSHVFGEITHSMVNGLDRAFIVWKQIDTPVIYDADGMPHKYRIKISSPAADEVGATGVDVDVNRHLLMKFGGYVGLSAIQGITQAGVGLAQGLAQHGNGNTNLSFYQLQGGVDSGANLWLQTMLQIPDVGTRDQGLACSIFLVRDLDVSGAYKLRVQQ